MNDVLKIEMNEAPEQAETASSKSIGSCVKFTPAEYREISDDARSEGKSIPVLLKNAYFKRIRTTILMKPDDEARWFKELRYWGKNLNQIAKVVNCGVMNGWHEEIPLILRSIKGIEQKILGIYGHG